MSADVTGVAVVIGTTASFAPSSSTRIKLVDGRGDEHVLAVVRIENTFYAIGDRCSHADVSLSDGTVWDDECELECPKHGSTFSLKTGEPQSFPATRPVPTYSVGTVGDDVVVYLPGPGSDVSTLATSTQAEAL